MIGFPLLLLPDASCENDVQLEDSVQDCHEKGNAVEQPHQCVLYFQLVDVADEHEYQVAKVPEEQRKVYHS